MDNHRARSITCPLRVAAWRRPRAPALRTTDGVVTYGELDARVTAAARQLVSGPCQPGDVVAIEHAADVTTIVGLLALWRHGAVACLFNLRNPPALRERQLADLKAAYMLAAPHDTSHVAGNLTPLILNAAGAEQASSGVVRLNGDQLATLLFTSGSGAEPKAAAHSYGNHYAAAIASNRHNGLAATDGWLLSLPLYHVGGLSILFRCLLAGAAVVLPAEGAPLVVAVRAPGVTHVSMVPTQLQRLLDAPGFEQAPANLKLILLGGAPAPDAVVTRALDRGWPVRKTYGLTEMSSQVATVPPNAPRAKFLTAGTALPFTELHLKADGEICVRGPALFCGYLEGERLVRPVDADGWYATGDLGEIDETGYLTVQGRKDNLFISGGENIQPEEIEMALAGLPGVVQAVVVPIRDGEFGQRPIAYVKAAAGELDATALTHALGLVLPRYKIPVAFHAWPAEAEAIHPKQQRRYFIERARTLATLGDP